MPKLVVMGALLKCPYGAAPAVLVVTPEKRVLGGTPAASVADCVPLKNIPPFGMCSSMANPQVAAATAAASGVLTPMPCVPVITGPWIPGSTSVMVGGMPALHDGCQCVCGWGGIITVQNPGQTSIEVP